MRKQQRKAQFILTSIGLTLVVLTYFYYPKINQNLKSPMNEMTQENLKKESPNDTFSSFENVIYEGLYDLDKPFSVKSEKAYLLEDDPDLVYMTNMHVIIYLKDGRVVDILSNKGRYNKVTYDCYFEENVRVTDKETKIFSENLDLLASENFVKVYNKVKLKNPTGSLNADQIDYNFETKYYKVSMFDEEMVKMKVIK
jgi:LPS export ABC transporter protein LptC